MNSLMLLLLIIIIHLIVIFTYAIYASIILSWVLALNLINPYNRIASLFIKVIHIITEPVLNQIRKVIPYVGPFDLSPLVALFLAYSLKSLILNLLVRM